MAWNRVRRHITRELDMAIADAREEALNALLTKAFDEFVQALGMGKVPEVESKYAAMSLAVVKDVVPDPKQILDGPSMD